MASKQLCTLHLVTRLNLQADSSRCMMLLEAGALQVHQLAKPQQWTARLIACASQIGKSACSSSGRASQKLV